MKRIEYNKKIVGKTVIVSTREKGDWRGTVVDVVNEDEFLVTDILGKTHNISIYDIRSLSNEKG